MLCLFIKINTTSACIFIWRAIEFIMPPSPRREVLLRADRAGGARGAIRPHRRLSGSSSIKLEPSYVNLLLHAVLGDGGTYNRTL